MIVFLLCGFWHGAAWNFLVWGAWHGLFLVLERLGLGALLAALAAAAAPLRPARRGDRLGLLPRRHDARGATLPVLDGRWRRRAASRLPERFLSTEVWLALAFGAVLATVPVWRMLRGDGRSLRSGPAGGRPDSTPRCC
jgi:hypothetical protein